MVTGRWGHCFRRGGPLVLGLVVSAMTGCATDPTPQPAILSPADAANTDRLRTALSRIVGRLQVDLGPENLSRSTSFSVRPPPLGPHEGRSPAKPEVFDLMIVGRPGQCLAIDRATGTAHDLPGVVCRPAAQSATAG